MQTFASKAFACQSSETRQDQKDYTSTIFKRPKLQVQSASKLCNTAAYVVPTILTLTARPAKARGGSGSGGGSDSDSWGDSGS